MGYASVLTLIRPGQPLDALTPVLDFAADSHTAIMVAANSPPVPVSAYDMLNGDMWARDVEAARADARTQADEIEKLLVARDQPGHVTAHVAGADGLSALVAGAARYVDLVVLAGVAGDDPALEHALVTGGLFEGGTAAVIAAPGQAIPVAPDLVQIAWNARPEAARAVKQALPLLRAAKRVQAVLIDPVPSVAGHGPEPGATFATYLGYHDIEVEVVTLPSEGMRDEEILTRQVQTEGADMLVMGAYGHARLRERIFGGTTRAMLDDPPCALFMAH